VITLCFLLVATGSRAQGDPPVITTIEPALACQGCVVRVVGSGFAAVDTDGTRLHLVRGQQTLTVALRSFSRSLGDGTPGIPRQSLTFGVPVDAVVGSWQLIVERDGRLSDPATFEVVQWVPPTLHGVTPSEAGRGERITLTGGSLPPQVSVEVLDLNANRLARVETGTRAGEIAITVPDSVPEGDVLVRISSAKDGVEWHSQPISLKVTAVPTPSIDARLMSPVKPGQWTTLRLDLYGHRIAVEAVDVEFHQGAQLIVSSYEWDGAPNTWVRMRVPPTLESGLVTLRARFSHDGRPTPWSPAVEFELLPVAADPVIHAIAVIRDQFPSAPWSRVDASPPLTLSEGDELLVLGDFPFETPRVTVTAHTSPNEPVSVPIISDRGDGVTVHLPPLETGEWTLRVHAGATFGPGDGGVVFRVER
jgi:hypothetical protein